jgi:hypothetical protein
VQHFHWEESLVVTSGDQRSLSKAKELQWEPVDITTSISELDAKVYELFIARAFKRLGLRFAVFLGDGEATKANLIAAEVKKTGGKGFGFLLSQESAWFKSVGD